MERDWIWIVSEAIGGSNSIPEIHDTFSNGVKPPVTHGSGNTYNTFYRRLPLHIFSRNPDLVMLNNFCFGKIYFYKVKETIFAKFISDVNSCTIRITKIYNNKDILNFLGQGIKKLINRDMKYGNNHSIVGTLRNKPKEFQEYFFYYLSVLKIVIGNIKKFEHVDISTSIFDVAIFFKKFDGSDDMINNVFEKLEKIYSTLNKNKCLSTINAIKNRSLEKIIFQKQRDVEFFRKANWFLMNTMKIFVALIVALILYDRIPA